VRRLLGALWRALVAGAPMGVAVWGAGVLAEDLADPAVLALQVGVGMVVYGSLAWWLERRLLRELLGRRRSRRSARTRTPEKETV
jgi:hypothetical protein